jgi:hypothetical protein
MRTTVMRTTVVWSTVEGAAVTWAPIERTAVARTTVEGAAVTWAPIEWTAIDGHTDTQTAHISLSPVAIVIDGVDTLHGLRTLNMKGSAAGGPGAGTLTGLVEFVRSNGMVTTARGQEQDENRTLND